MNDVWMQTIDIDTSITQIDRTNSAIETHWWSRVFQWMNMVEFYWFLFCFPCAILCGRPKKKKTKWTGRHIQHLRPYTISGLSDTVFALRDVDRPRTNSIHKWIEWMYLSTTLRFFFVEKSKTNPPKSNSHTESADHRRSALQWWIETQLRKLTAKWWSEIHDWLVRMGKLVRSDTHRRRFNYAKCDPYGINWSAT